MFATLFAAFTLFSCTTVAQQTPTVVCVPGQCLQGFSNTTIGAVLSAPGSTTDIHLLPGQYSSSTSPQLLHNLLTSASATLSPSAGFNGTLSLPLNLALQPGVTIYSNALYSGHAGFSALPNTTLNSSVPLTARSLSLSSNVWIATTSGPSNQRTIIWNSIPDFGQLPFTSSNTLSLVDIQSSACSPPCSGSGVCSAAGTCQCAPGFTGASCETCASGFFGPQCKACPTGCSSCDDGITGSGRCLNPTVANAPSTCNCLNGVCGANGQCACNPGFTTGDNGTLCSKCSPGFFLTSTGDCKVCELGCTQCTDGTGVCTVCKSGFTQNPSDRTKCNPPQSSTSSGTICPDGSFGNGASCSPCSSACETCTAGTSNDCIVCASGLFSLNGACVGTNSVGVCEGSNLIADNNKKECDACGAKCTSCQIPNFNGASTVNLAQCTGCLPGFVLSNGTCTDSCPSGTFLSPQDNLTCLPCDSSCGTCAGSSTFCLTCASNQLASNGQCVSTCPSNTFSSSGSCLTCHSDCTSCSGGSFNQCTSCPPNRPVLLNGRCLPTCSQSQFFDPTSSTCQSCDSSCSSCSAAGPSNCLACSSSTQVLRAGSCVAANCQQTSAVLPGLGVCLSELVDVPQASGTSTSVPLPTITGIDTPTAAIKRALPWWQILLMALGCALIFLIIGFSWRCCAKRQRAKETIRFATTPGYNRSKRSGCCWWFPHPFRSKPKAAALVVIPHETESIKLMKLRAAEEARHENDMDQIIAEYEYDRSAPSPPGESSHQYYHRTYDLGDRLMPGDRRSLASSHSDPSIYSHVTGVPRKVPEPRQPLKKQELTSRFSMSTYMSEGRHLPARESRRNRFWK